MQIESLQYFDMLRSKGILCEPMFCVAYNCKFKVVRT